VKVAVLGAGAIGAYVGAALHRAGADVHLIARGPNLAAMRRDGVRVISPRGDFTAHTHATDDPAEVGPVDYVFLGLKANSYAACGPLIEPLLHDTTAVVAAQNGIPWWYFDRHGGPLDGTRLRTVDPGGVIAAHLDARRVVGCVVYPATTLVGPGVVEHVEGTRLSLGELDGTSSERCRAIAAALIKGGLKAPIRSRIRDEIWLKLLGNVCFNPLSALTRATMAQIATDPEMRAVARAIMEEADSVARALGIELAIGVDQRLAGAEKVGAHKTSMLQDVESGRPLEVEAVVGAVVEIADLLRLPLPHLRTVYACTRLLDQGLRSA